LDQLHLLRQLMMLNLEDHQYLLDLLDLWVLLQVLSHR
jgi:hypothetical protein